MDFLLIAQDAGVNWTNVVAVIITVLTTVGSGIGVAIKLLITHLEKQGTKQEVHEDKLFNKFEDLAIKFNNTVREFKDEQQEMIKTLLQIQGSTIQATIEHGHKIQDLGKTITDLKQFLERQGTKQETKEGNK